MIDITIDEEIMNACPHFHFRAIACSINNDVTDDDLWHDIETFCEAYKSAYEFEDIKKIKPIAATREVYKKLGKDPNRYRPSAEAMLRRVVKGRELYRINAAVDLINLVSLRSGYSIGGFDLDRIEGNLILGIGKANEKFNAIGRGELNIEGLPVYRDAVGGIGTPTSDVERTKITTSTKKLLMIVNGYSGSEGLNEIVDYAVELLKRYAKAENIEIAGNNTPPVSEGC